jgi:RNA 2',3'-cyclic 3'-phosphodiesterase
MARLFVAVWPPPEVMATIAALDRPAIDGLRWTTPDQWHATLWFIGEGDVADVSAALARIDAARTTAVMGPSIARFDHRILHAPVAGLDALAAAVRPAGQPPFRGHLTLARVGSRRRVDLRPFCGVPIAGEWPVDELTLVASELHPKGARYQVVARQPLS